MDEDILAELEMMTTNASCDTVEDETVAVRRWKDLFSYDDAKASHLIAQQRQDPASLVSPLLWQTVRVHEEKLGHDRESYSHLLRLPRPCSIAPDATNDDRLAESTEYLLKLDGPLDSPERIGSITGFSSPPRIYQGSSDSNDDDTRFCRLGFKAKQAIVDWLAANHPSHRPLFIPQSIAAKQLCPYSQAPFVGRDSTLPQYRARDMQDAPLPAQDQYPVMYFFYGTLADQGTLSRLFHDLDGERDVEYELYPAKITDAQLSTWAGKYKTLIDGHSEISGSAFLVRSWEHEYALRLYETSAYEVARCNIIYEDPHKGERAVHGCTFRFVGPRGR